MTRAVAVHACAGLSAAGHAMQIARLVLECEALRGHTNQQKKRGRGRLESAL